MVIKKKFISMHGLINVKLYRTLIRLQGLSGICAQRRYILAAAVNRTPNPINRQYSSLPLIFTYLHGVLMFLL